ncbi:uncharacterized protein C12orf56 homolog isoform X2 [Trachinotus anak]|uniref:uncharacterized protein C12orf56 homolog isoform X2 n=1 Tax=Trachinotus anak TaxID=443729 RepID=UPI0039F1FC3E
MARPGPGSVRLDRFLRRNTERAVYERIRTCEPCVVVSERVNKVYMHVVLSDERVYLTEHPPRALTAAVSFGRVRDIELVNDLPDFLSGKDRERCQHIRIVYVTDEPAAVGWDWLRRDKKAGLPPPAPPSRRNSHCPSITHNFEGYPAERSHGGWRKEEVHMIKPTRSASCPNPETLGLPRVPHPPTQPLSTEPRLYSPGSSPTSPRSASGQSVKTVESGQAPRRVGSVLSRLLRRDRVTSGEEREAELHLYAVSQTSRLYLHLQSSWNSFIIRSTLLLDPLYRRKCNASSDPSPGKQRPAISWERTAHLFGQLSSELLQDGISVESLYLLLQELRTAAHRNVALRRLFWRTSRCFSVDNLLSVGWILRVLQPHPHLLPFIGHQAQQVVQVLSELQESVLSPVEAVLLFQRCRLLLACLQYHSQLAQHLRSHFREEFRYFVKLSCVEEKLPPHYPISLPTLQLVKHILNLIVHR